MMDVKMGSELRSERIIIISRVRRDKGTRYQKPKCKDYSSALHEAVYSTKQ